MTFQNLGLSPELTKILEDKGYTVPSPIQEKMIPLFLEGRDILACAPTGTGKTAAFALPMIEILSGGRSKARIPRSLILEPTRELAAQVAQNFRIYTQNHKMDIALLIGGESILEQERMLNRGVDILIATPGRFLDLHKKGKILLSDTKILVIDESDRMMDMGFIPDIKRISKLLPPIRQTILLSATMSKEIKNLSQEFLKNPKEVVVERIASDAIPIDQHLIQTASGKGKEQNAQKHDLCIKLIEKFDTQSAIIFCNRKRDVDSLYKFLKQQGFLAEALHGDLSQSRRNQALDKFRKGKALFLVASDVAARGIDVSNLPCVINFDVPANPEDYIHRIGRTGRAGLKGLAFTFVTEKEKKAVESIFKLIGKKIPFLTDFDKEMKEGSLFSLDHSKDHSRDQKNSSSKPFHKKGGTSSKTEHRGRDRGPRPEGQKSEKKQAWSKKPARKFNGPKKQGSGK